MLYINFKREHCVMIFLDMQIACGRVGRYKSQGFACPSLVDGFHA